VSQRRSNNIMVRLTDAELARLDELRPAGTNRSAFLRSLLREPPSGDEVATRSESLGILSTMARDGKVAAAIALARELREEGAPAPAGELRELIGDR
jgi:hypothetical protein